MICEELVLEISKLIFGMFPQMCNVIVRAKFKKNDFFL